MRRVLSVVGAIAILPCVGTAILLAMETFRPAYRSLPLATGKLVVGWIVAFAMPLLFAWILRKRMVWINLLFAVWTYGVVLAASHTIAFSAAWKRNTSVTAVLYLLLAFGAVGLAAWGVYEKRAERINLGMAGFALSVLFFYFDNFMDKLGRSAGLLILGLLCLAGGYGLERLRRKLMTRMRAIT